MVTRDALASAGNWLERNDVLSAELMPLERIPPVDVRTPLTGDACLAAEQRSPQPPDPASGSQKTAAAARVYTELEVSSEAFDRPANRVCARIIICSTPRTGSYLLCRAMIHAGIGIPHEYFNLLNAGIIGTRYGLGTITGDDLRTDGAKRRAYIAALLEHRTANGVFAVKIQRAEFRLYFDNHKAVDLFKGAHFIYLYREDLVAQAVSFHMSLLTGRWGVDDVVTTRPAINRNFFDNSGIMAIMDELVTQDSEWRLFFAKNGIKPLFFSYEGIRRDLSDALRRIVTSFGLDVPSENSNYTEPQTTEYRGPGEPSKSEVRNRFAQWLQTYAEAEGFIKLLRAAREKEVLEHPAEIVVAAYIEATAACPTRAEALHGASRFCRRKGMHEQGYAFAIQGLALNYPKNAPLLEEWIYAYGLLDEFSIHAYWTGRYRESLDACQRLLGERRMPAHQYDRVRKNAEFAAGKLGLQKPLT